MAIRLDSASAIALEASLRERTGSRFGLMRVIETNQHSGRRYLCPCGWKGWSVWGSAINHVHGCKQAQGVA